MFQVRFIIVLVCCLSLLGCGGKKVSTIDVRAFVTDSCPSKDGAKPQDGSAALVGAIIAAVAPVAIGKTIDFIGNTLSKAAEADEYMLTVPATDGYLQVQAGKQIVLPETGCLTVVVGDFGTVGSDGLDGYKNQKIKNFLKKIGVASPPKLYFESLIQRSRDDSSVKMQAQYFEYGSNLASSFKKERDLAFTFLLQQPGNTATEAAKSTSFATGTMVFKGVVPGVRLNDIALTGKTTAWMSGLKLEKGVDKDGLLPYTLQTVIVETKNADPFLQLASGIFEGSKDEVKKELVKVIVNPDKAE
ncbi:hypothetical protein [Maridesulfovibrio sp. FT414]|uniref:hypothetical protein n=1 Tax=Maridesulfovibrio sp. FT414 TaxID=2979469 RepID=UPI003D8019F2